MNFFIKKWHTLRLTRLTIDKKRFSKVERFIFIFCSIYLSYRANRTKKKAINILLNLDEYRRSQMVKINEHIKTIEDIWELTDNGDIFKYVDKISQAQPECSRNKIR